ncbi:hypothetical protein HYY75_06890 [bacterium]|nr:hypothetical protein [bacterium]
MLVKKALSAFFLLSLISHGCFGVGLNPQFKPNEYVLKLYQRVLSIGQAILEFEEETIARLKSKHPIDSDSLVSRFLSGKSQIKALRKLARRFESRVSNSDPLFPKIQSLKERLISFLRRHRQNGEKLKELGGSKWIASFKGVDDAFSDGEIDPNCASFPVRTIDEQF